MILAATFSPFFKIKSRLSACCCKGSSKKEKGFKDELPAFRLLVADELVTSIVTAFVFNVLPSAFTDAGPMVKFPFCFGLNWYDTPIYCFVTPLLFCIPLSWLGPLTTIKSFKEGGINRSTWPAFSIISLSSVVSSLPIVEGLIVAVKRAWASNAC